MDHSNCEKQIAEPSDKGEIYGKEDGRELKLGMEVNSDAEAYNLCNAYAIRMGFSIRKGHVRRDASNNIRQRTFLCSKEGFQRDEDLCEVKKVNRLETRTGCKALIRFNVENGVWKIFHINANHNHELAKPEERKFLRSGQRIYDAHFLSSMVGASTKPPKSHLSNELDGGGNGGLTKKDEINYSQRKNGEMIEAGAVQGLLNHLKRKQGEDPNFFYSIGVDRFNRITSFFWRDRRSKVDYDCFGDVVCFDTTFRTNKSNLICAPFMGVNHHWKNVLFGCAFLLDKSTESFVWLFDSFLESMGNKQPNTIFTNEDKALKNAIEIMFSDTRHRLGTWHIAKNATKYLPGYYANSEFKKQLNKCFHECHNETEFQVSWDDMVSRFDLGNHSWMKDLYSLREKWSLAFGLDIFSANIISTQRTESTNNIFHQISTKTTDLIEFVHHYEKKAKVMRFAELEEDYRCKNGVPHLKVRSGILSHAVNAYTIKMFNFFEMELMNCIGVRMKEVSKANEVYNYEGIEEGEQRVYKIQYNSLTMNVSCSCKLFESMGILCRHALKVFDLNNLTSIPAQYILKRWTKEAKKGCVVSNDKFGLSSEKAKSTQSLRLNELMHEGDNVFSIASMTDSGTKIAKEKLAEAMKLLQKDTETINMLEHLKKVDDQSNCDFLANESTLFDPPAKKTKGMKSGGSESNLEMQKRKAAEGQDNRETVGGPYHPTAPPQPASFSPSVHQFGASNDLNFE